MRHLLPDGAAEDILAYYKATEPWTSKQIPRLEKVLDDAVHVFGPDVLNILRFFAAAEPNPAHYMIGQAILDHKVYGFTTNFDRCIEKAFPEIPVITPQSGEDASWGLVKVHGSIDETLSTLGATIGAIQGGLPHAISDRLRFVLNDTTSEIIFCGYSGSDFFDVTPIFEAGRQAGEPFPCSAIWIEHALSDSLRGEAFPDHRLAYGPRAILSGIARTDPWLGSTQDLLAERLGSPDPVRFPQEVSPLEGRDDPHWSDGWNEQFSPSEAQKNEFAAKLYASLGIGLESFRYARRMTADRTTERQTYLLNAIRDIGDYRTEYRLAQECGPVSHRSCLMMHRLNQHYGRAGYGYWRIVQSSSAALEQRYGSAEALGLALEAGLYFRQWETRLPRTLLCRLACVPIERWIRRRVETCLAHFQALAKLDAHSASDPHYLGMAHRLGDFIGSPPQNDCLIRWLGQPTATLDHVDMSGDYYMETDSFLGIVNHCRNEATNALIQIDLGWWGPKKTTNTHFWLSYAESALRQSYYLAKEIHDDRGEVKALRALAKVYAYDGRRQRARLIRALSKRRAAQMKRRHQDFMLADFMENAYS